MFSLRTDRRDVDEVGFTLIELLVSLTLLALVAAGLVPLLVSAARADQLTKLQTQAKSLSVARLGAMRSLPFHVDYQNGAYLDVLDEYYTNASASSNCVPATKGTGSYGTGVVPGQSASGAYYRVDFGVSVAPCGFTQVLPTGFTQSVYTQFLSAASATGSSRSIVTPQSTYDSQVSGADAPASPLIGVTVVTTYGATHSFRTYTEISDAGHDTPLVIGQAGATAVSVDSHAADGSLVSALLAQVGIDGTLSNTSNASASAIGSRFSRSDASGSLSFADVDGAVGSVSSPPVPATAADQTVPGVNAGGPGTGGCGWAAAGHTATTNVSANVSGAQPLAPANVESTTTPVPTVNAMVNANGGGGSCGAFAYTNLLSGSLNPALGLSSASPQILVPDMTGSGPVLTSSAYLDTPSLAATSPVKAAATSTLNSSVLLFPGMSFIPSSTPYHQALVAIDLTAVSIACSSNVVGATASYSGTVRVWTQPNPAVAGSYQAISFTWTGGAAPTLPALTTPVTYTSTGTPVPLSTWLQSWQFNGLVEQAPPTGTSSEGRHTLPSALTLSTQPTLLTGATSVPDPATDLLLNVGRVSCVTEDHR